MPDRLQATPLCYNDLDATLREAWTLLLDAVKDRRASMHTISIATIGADNTPKVRTVVLRHVNRASRVIRFHADQRSDKVSELRRNSAVQALAYDVERKIQLRLSGTAAVHTSDGIADKAWEGSRPMSRLCYRQDAAPGTQAADPRALLAYAEQDGRENFSVVEISVQELDWVFLSTQGNRRAKFTWSTSGHTSSWLAP